MPTEMFGDLSRPCNIKIIKRKGEDFFAFSFTALLYLLIFYFIYSELRSLTCNHLVEVLQATLLQVTYMTKYLPMVAHLSDLNLALQHHWRSHRSRE
jgi:hypothetical protein